MADRALGFGAVKGHIDTETEKAVAKYASKLGTGLRPDLQPSRELQKMLTEPLPLPDRFVIYGNLLVIYGNLRNKGWAVFFSDLCSCATCEQFSMPPRKAISAFRTAP